MDSVSVLFTVLHTLHFLRKLCEIYDVSSLSFTIGMRFGDTIKKCGVTQDYVSSSFCLLDYHWVLHVPLPP